MEQGGVKMVVRGARGAVMVAAILRGCKPWTSPHKSSQVLTSTTTSTADRTGWRIYDGWFLRLRPPTIDGRGRQDQDEGRRAILLTGHSTSKGAIGIAVDLSLFSSRRSFSILVPSPHMMA